jgi:putative MATE family efflux protein
MEDPLDAERESAVREVEADLAELGDPEAGAVLPSTTIAAHAAVAGHAASLPGLGADLEGPVARELFRLSWPVALTMGLVSIGNLVDGMMIGWLDDGRGAAIPLAAAGYATQLFFLIQSMLFAVGLACVAIMARAIGSGDLERARTVFAASLQVAVVVSGAAAALLFFFATDVLRLLGAEPSVIETALPYLRLMLSSTILLAVCMAVDSALRANKDMKTPLRIAVVVTTIKLSGNWLFIYGFGVIPALGLTGAGVATLLAQIAGVLLFALAVRREPSDSPVKAGLRHWRRAAEVRGDVVRIAIPGVIERIVMSGSQLLYFAVLSRYYGTLAVAAYTVGIRLLSFTWIPGNGYAQGCATLVGQALGAGAPQRAVRVGWTAAGLALGTSIVVGTPFAVYRHELAALFTNDATVVEALGPFMLALALGQPFLQLHFTLGGAHRGAGDTFTPLVAATATNIVRFAMAWLCAAVFETSVNWVWAAIIVDHALRAMILAGTFRSGIWLSPQDRQNLQGTRRT